MLSLDINSPAMTLPEIQDEAYDNAAKHGWPPRMQKLTTLTNGRKVVAEI